MAARRTGGLGKGLDALIPNKVGGAANETSKKTKRYRRRNQLQNVL